MDLKTYLRGLPDEFSRDHFAARCDTSAAHLRNVAYGQKSCGIQLAVNVERESSGAVTRRELRPDDWRALWPELAAASEPV